MNRDISINARLGMGAHAAVYGIGATLGAIAADQASAAVVVKTGTPLTMSDGAFLSWDVDGDGTANFFLEDCGGPAALQASFFGNAPNDDFLVGAGSLELAAIIAGSVVGPSSAGDWNGAPCSPETDASGTAAFYGFLNYATAPDFSGVLGFRFDNGGTINYGVAKFTFANWDGLAPIGTLTINSWAYDDTGAALTYTAGMLGSVPAPPAALLLMSGLAMGAAGLRRRRKALRVH